jgi:predicted MFS family arabinose efflux permease
MAATLYRVVELVQSKLLIASLALITHYILHNDEWDHSITVFFNIWVVAFGSVAAIEYVADPRAQTVGSALQSAATVAAIYFSALVTSILLHRGFFHRLRKVSSTNCPPDN